MFIDSLTPFRAIRFFITAMNTVLMYELDKLEHLITRVLHITPEPSVPMTDNLLLESAKLLDSEEDRIKKKWVHEIYAFPDERQLERYIQLHQQELIRLLDLLAGMQTQSKQIDDLHWHELYRHACHSIEELLIFVEKHFTKYFDPDTKAPVSYITLTGSDIIRNYGDLQKELQQLNALPELIDHVLTPIKLFIENIPSNQITYRRIIYVKEVYKELQQLITHHNREMDINEHLRQTMLYLNYNTIKYFRYFTNYIVEQLADVDSGMGRIEKLSFLLKSVNQTQVKPGVGFNRTIPPMKEQLGDWMTEEIIYLEKMHKLSEKQAANTTLSEEFRMKTELSVAQLAYLLKIFIDIKIINNKNTSDLIRFFARFFQTKRMETISYESLRVRFYNVEDSTKKSVRSLLLLMVDHINKM